MFSLSTYIVTLYGWKVFFDWPIIYHMPRLCYSRG